MSKNYITIISVNDKSINELFEETKDSLNIKKPVKRSLIKDKIYMYSKALDNSIIGYAKLHNIDFDNGIYTLKFICPTEFDEHLSINEIRKMGCTFDLSRQISYIPYTNPLFHLINMWDKAFSLDGNLCRNAMDEKIKIKRKIKSMTNN